MQPRLLPSIFLLAMYGCSAGDDPAPVDSLVDTPADSDTTTPDSEPDVSDTDEVIEETDPAELAPPAGCEATHEDMWSCRGAWNPEVLLPAPVLQQQQSASLYDVTVAEITGMIVRGLTYSTLTAAAGDLDGDGDHDLIVSANPGESLVLRNEGEMRLEPWLTDDAPPIPPFVHPAIVDLDRDGRAEVITVGMPPGLTSAELLGLLDATTTGAPPAEPVQPTIAVLTPTASGWEDVTEAWGFSRWTDDCDHEEPPIPTGITVGDYDRDDILDVAILQQPGCRVTWYTSGQGDGWAQDLSMPATEGQVALHALDWDEDGWLDVFATSFAGESELGKGRAWFGHDGGWTERPLGAQFGPQSLGSPMGLLPVDLMTSSQPLAIGGDGQWEWLASDLRGLELDVPVDDALFESAVVAGVDVPETRWGGDTIPWAVSVLPTTPDEQWLFAVAGFEHLVEAIPQHLLALQCLRGETQCVPRHEIAHGDRAPDEGGAVHERGLVVADLWDADPSAPCPELFPLPVAGTEPRILLPRQCGAGVRLSLRTRGGMPAYGATVEARYSEERVQRQFVTAHRGYAGFSPAELTVPTDDLVEVEITWPSGERSTHELADLATGTLQQP